MNEIPLKRCSRGDNCVHSMGCWQPATNEYFSKHNQSKGGLRPHCKACQKTDSAEYYSRNKAEIIRRTSQYHATHRAYYTEKSREYDEKHRDKRNTQRRQNHALYPEKRHAISKRHREKNHDKILKTEAERRDRNREQLNERARQRRLKNPELFRIKEKRYLDKHPGIKRIRDANSHARKLGADGHLGRDDVQIMFKGQGGKCWYCGADLNKTGYHIDHFIPLSKGGTNDIGNLRLACPTCNLRKSAKSPHEWSGRLL